ncbi:MAG: hypothetical protein HUU35_13550, partial [Armatimonadetes bacterium]|nr:hypothetical protein [Armatimonadota bacterium]
AFLGGHNYFHAFIGLENLAAAGVQAPSVIDPDMMVALVSVLIALGGIVLGVVMYGSREGLAVRRFGWSFAPTRALLTLPKRLYFMNEVLYLLLVRPLLFTARLCDSIDRFIIDAAVNLVAWLTLLLSGGWRWFDQVVIDQFLVLGPAVASRTTAELGKFLQSGKVQGYALLAMVGLLLLVVARVWLLS